MRSRNPGSTAATPRAERRVIFVNRFYAPDQSATAQLLTDLAQHLAAQGWSVMIEWVSSAEGAYLVEASTDLLHWAPVALEILPSEKGVTRVRCEAMLSSATFFRLRPKP